MSQPVAPRPYYRSPWYVSRVFLVISAVLFFFAAVTFGGSSILNATAWQWMAGAFCAYVLAWAVP